MPYQEIGSHILKKGQYIHEIMGKWGPGSIIGVYLMHKGPSINYAIKNQDFLIVYCSPNCGD